MDVAAAVDNDDGSSSSDEEDKERLLARNSGIYSDHSKDEWHDAESVISLVPVPVQGTDAILSGAISVEDELIRRADEHATGTVLLIERIKESIVTYQKMDQLGPSEERTLHFRQKELLEKLNDFEVMTKRVRSVVGVGDGDDTDLQVMINLSACEDKQKLVSHGDEDNNNKAIGTSAEMANKGQTALKTAEKARRAYANGGILEHAVPPAEEENAVHRRAQNGESECVPCVPEEKAETPTHNNTILQMECELEEMQHELAQVKKERECLENQRRALKNFATDACIPGKALREGWRSDQLLRLQEDLDCKILENQTLHAQVERLKAAIEATQRGMDDWESRACELEQKLRLVESHKNKMAESKVKQMELQQQLTVAENKCRETQDEMDELRALVDDQSGHLECYRNKYLLAQQQVEEQKRQIEQMEADQGRIGEQVQMEIQRLKAQFQDRLQELSPLPELLRSSQAKLQEAQQLRVIAENNCEDLSKELQTLSDKNTEYEAQICKLRTTQQQLIDERTILRAHLDTFEGKCCKMKEEINRYKQMVAHLEDTSQQTERALEEKQHENARLRVEVETLKEAAARQAARFREKFDTQRRSLQGQLADLEQDLACSRANTATAIRERDELQQKLHAQVTHLSQSFGQTQDRIKTLQNVVDVLQINIEPGQLEANKSPEC